MQKVAPVPGSSIRFVLGDPPPEKVVHGWTWYRSSSHSGPFEGIGDATPLKLTAGKHTFYLIQQEDGAYMDAIFATWRQGFDANKTPSGANLAVEPQEKLPIIWGDVKRRF